MSAKYAEEKLKIFLLVFPVWRLENGYTAAKKLENLTSKGNLVSKAHKKF